MSLQPLFMRFHEKILLKRFGENAELIEKRDRVLTRLRDNLKVSFTPFNQGSYELGTGVKPVDLDYDIDVGVVLNARQEDYANNPLAPKGWVYQAVESHTTKVRWRTNCITVYYQQAGEVKFHVDLPVFLGDARGRLYLSVGKQHGTGSWQHDERKQFNERFEIRHQGEDAQQFRRVIRYLKRWKSHNFPSNGWAAPTGHALTVAAYEWFQPVKSYGWSPTYDDLVAMKNLVNQMRAQFQPTWTAQGYVRRLRLPFPVAPGDDVFGKMSDQQMLEFERRLATLSEALAVAERTQSPTPLQGVFGPDFPAS